MTNKFDKISNFTFGLLGISLVALGMLIAALGTKADANELVELRQHFYQKQDSFTKEIMEIKTILFEIKGELKASKK